MQSPAPQAGEPARNGPLAPLSGAEAAGNAAPPAGAHDPERLERILVEEGLVSREQVARARRIRERLEEPRPLAELVVELGWVSRAQLEGALRRRRRELAIEDILVEKGVLSPERLDRAREALRRRPGRRLGEYLVETGQISERDYLEACCDRYDLPFVEADATLVDPQALEKVSLQYLARHHVLPLSIQDGRLTVLVADPERPHLVEELARLYGCPVGIALATRDKIDEALKGLGGARRDTRQATELGAIQYHRIVETVDGDKVTSIVDRLFLKALQAGASDIHVEPMESKLRVRLRVDGSLVHLTDYPAGYAGQIISRLKVLAQADVAEHRVHQDGRIYVRHGQGEVDCRASFYVTVFGENAVIRVLRKEQALVGLERLGMSPATLRAFIDDAIEPSTGIVLVTGPTGSGKTTTLYAVVDRLNDDTRKIITCEDPVEYVVPGVTQCSVADRAGITFLDSLRAIVRQDPDIILIGEIRDRASAEMAIQSALTGHKVLSTFHTEDSVGALLRLLDMNIEAFLIASTLSAVLGQRLVRRPCPACREEHVPAGRELRVLGLAREELAGFALVRGRGCPACLHTGYRGRVGVYELLIMTDALRDAILQRRSSHELRRLALEAPSFVHLREDGLLKAARGETTLAEVLASTPRVQTCRPLTLLTEAT
jgi:type IV pilus assembly protein PilB